MRFELPPLAPDVTWSVAVRDADTDASLATHAPDALLRTASVGKVFALIEAARRFADGTLDPAEPLTRTPDDDVADSGLWQALNVDALPVADLCALVGAVSDNLATNVLVRRLGLDAIGALSRDLGCVGSALLDRVRDERGPGVPWTLSVGRADEWSALMARLHRGEVISEPVSAQVRGWLAANADLSMVGSGFDLDPLAHREADRGVTLFNKTGTISVVRADVGAVRGPAGSIAWAALASWDAAASASRGDPRDAVLASMRAIGTRIRRAIGA